MVAALPIISAVGGLVSEIIQLFPKPNRDGGEHEARPTRAERRAARQNGVSSPIPSQEPESQLPSQESPVVINVYGDGDVGDVYVNSDCGCAQGLHSIEQGRP